ncbi:hypothetical protein GLOTRDRAFT_123962 [Gloeophyllum trabeum ATCC 11539]|uniref:Uncharacterized protein n=1 Tax=Gloeophyllum trabeum (strain ATCC 11539 / FP-39264 / Madison 617) TaxID=670483 RepID=S7RZ02_GLOTA|nr:uncharacterized protein GLOTRDRAFT_123962 [Gloeophyllum trabeum ATCC 11539]EPQ60205.1 hypothetical protein GLOTRDRAFT_123962 [Gloeophyllum trabeum ATCC 11539]
MAKESKRSIRNILTSRMASPFQRTPEEYEDMSSLLPPSNSGEDGVSGDAASENAESIEAEVGHSDVEASRRAIGQGESMSSIGASKPSQTNTKDVKMYAAPKKRPLFSMRRKSSAASSST